MQKFKLIYGIRNLAPTYYIIESFDTARDALMRARKLAVDYHKECENTAMPITAEGEKDYWEKLEQEIFYEVKVFN